MTNQLESMKKKYDAVMSRACSQAFVDVISNHPDATLSDLSEFAEEYVPYNITLRELFGDLLPLEHLPKDELPSAMRELKKKTINGLSMRTKHGRKEYDEAVISFLRGNPGWGSAKDIRESCGGDANQARASLNRLIESGDVDYKGRASAVRYKAI